MALKLLRERGYRIAMALLLLWQLPIALLLTGKPMSFHVEVVSRFVGVVLMAYVLYEAGFWSKRDTPGPAESKTPPAS
jgi:hypothetical protein